MTWRLGSLLKVSIGVLGAWAYALTLPDGSQRPMADDILSIISLKDQPQV
jgi:hypothetical protein